MSDYSDRIESNTVIFVCFKGALPELFVVSIIVSYRTYRSAWTSSIGGGKHAKHTHAFLLATVWPIRPKTVRRSDE
jgi:hypothetical protein